MNWKAFPITLLINSMVVLFPGATAVLFGVGCGRNPVSADDTAPSAKGYSAEVPLAWYTLQLKLVQETSGFSPPVASRALGYSGIALYEAVVPGIPTNRSLAGQLNGLSALPESEPDQEYHWPSVANAALASICRKLFPNASSENREAITALESEFSERFSSELRPEVTNRSVMRGRAVADAVYAWSHDDGGHEGYLRNFPSTYTPPVGPGLWAPSAPGLSRALQPYWGNNRPFILSSGGECQPGPPPTYSEDTNSAFYKELMEVYTTTRNLTPEQQAIAKFWSDDAGATYTPPGHTISILNQVIEQDKVSLDIAAEAYAKVGIAVADAFICCWNTKYRYNLLRPVTCINALIDPDWESPIATPPFPEYTSGHSVQCAASAEVLTGLFGNRAFTDHTHDRLGLAARSYGSFQEAANEAAISRLYGGIHFRSAIEKGLDQGREIGRKINAIGFRK